VHGFLRDLAGFSLRGRTWRRALLYPDLKAMPITTMNTAVTTIDSRTRITGYNLPQMV
jgi:hypothetical protein